MEPRVKGKKNLEGTTRPCVDPRPEPKCPFEDKILDETRKIREEFLHKYTELFDKPLYQEILDHFCDRSPLLCANATQTGEGGKDQGPDISEVKPEPRRKKRFLGFFMGSALGITGTALSVRNNYMLRKLGPKINAVQMAAETLAGNAEMQSESIRKLQFANEHVFHFLHHSLQSIRDIVARTQCQANQHAYGVKGELVLYVFREKLQIALQSVTQAALTGELTPELICVSSLSEILSHHPGFSDTVIAKQISLAYQYGHVYGGHMDYKNLVFGFYWKFQFPVRLDYSPCMR